MTREKSRRTAFAIGAVVALVGVAFAATMYFTDAETEDSHALAGSADPVATLAQMSAPLPAADAAMDASSATAAQAHADAEAALEAALADAQADVDAVHASEILLGTDGGFEALVGDLEAYDIAELHGRLGAQTGDAFLWQNIPSTAQLGDDAVRFEQTGHAEADEVLLQAEGVLAQVQQTWQGAEVQGLFATVEQTAAEQGAPVGFPGLVKSPFGAEDAMEPDEQGAAEAYGHADLVLSYVGSGYGDLSAGLDQALASQQGLVAEVEAKHAAADAFQADATAAIAAEHKARLAAIERARADHQDRVSAAAEAYLSELDGAAADAEGRLDAALDEQSTALEAARAEAEAELDAYLTEVRSEADGRIAAIQAAEADARATMDADLAAFLVASAEAQAQIAAQVAGAEAQVESARAQLHAESEARAAALQATVDDARADLAAQVAEAHAWSQTQVGLLTDVEASFQDAVTAEAQLRATTEALVEGTAEAHKADVLARAYAAVDEARGYAADAQATVGQVQQDAYVEVGKDLAYIQAVVDDYNSIPTPERQAAAEAWSQAQGTLDGTLGTVLVQGGQIGARAEAVLEAAGDAEAGLSAF